MNAPSDWRTDRYAKTWKRLRFWYWLMLISFLLVLPIWLLLVTIFGVLDEMVLNWQRRGDRKIATIFFLLAGTPFAIAGIQLSTILCPRCGHSFYGLRGYVMSRDRCSHCSLPFESPNLDRLGAITEELRDKTPRPGSEV